MSSSNFVNMIRERTIDIVDALQQIRKIATESKNVSAMFFASNEIRGYTNNSNLPSYRSLLGALVFSGLHNNSKIDDVPLSDEYINEDIKKAVESYGKITASIGDIIDAINVAKPIKVEVKVGDGISRMIFSASKGVVYCAKLDIVYNIDMLKDIVNSIYNQTIEVAQGLEQAVGNLDMHIDTAQGVSTYVDHGVTTDIPQTAVVRNSQPSGSYVDNVPVSLQSTAKSTDSFVFSEGRSFGTTQTYNSPNFNSMPPYNSPSFGTLSDSIAKSIVSTEPSQAVEETQPLHDTLSVSVSATESVVSVEPFRATERIEPVVHDFGTLGTLSDNSIAESTVSTESSSQTTKEMQPIRRAYPWETVIHNAEDSSTESTPATHENKDSTKP